MSNYAMLFAKGIAELLTTVGNAKTTLDYCAALHDLGLLRGIYIDLHTANCMTDAELINAHTLWGGLYDLLINTIKARVSS